MASRSAPNREPITDLREAYRARAEECGFDGHIGLARAMD
jgi:hypothetical protein